MDRQSAHRPQTWPRAPRHSAGPDLRTGASAHTTASSSDLRRRSVLSSMRVRSGDTFTDPSGRRIHLRRLMSFAQEVSATAVPPGRCRLSVASFYRRRYIFTQCATPEGRESAREGFDLTDRDLVRGTPR